MNLLIMDDATLIRRRIVELLSELQGIDAILESDDVASAVKMIEEHQPEVIILDIQVPPDGVLRNGIDVLRLTKKKHPKSGVIMLTNFANQQYMEECTRAGADFFFDKSNEFDRLPEAVSEIMRRHAKGGQPGDAGADDGV